MPNVELFLERTVQDDNGTFGVLTGGADNQVGPLGVTCEPPDSGDHPCIPAGTYNVVPHDSPAHPKSFELQDVPGRSGILIHPGNTAADTKGCILPGLTFGMFSGKPGVLSSADAMMMLHVLLDGAESVTITVT